MVLFGDHRATNFARLETLGIATATEGGTFGRYIGPSLHSLQIYSNTLK